MTGPKIEKVFISDLHLGNQFADTVLLEDFLDYVRAADIELHLIGDIFDAWRHVDLYKAASFFKGVSAIVYIEGNHDKEFAEKNPFQVVAKDFDKLAIGNKELLVTHGHLFDLKFKDTGVIGRIADEYLYLSSLLLRKDLRNYIVRYANSYSDKIELNAATSNKMKDFEYAIIGHTHKGGHRLVKGKSLFNLGSWLTEPWGFFTMGDKYAFQKIKEEKLYPVEADFLELV